MSKIVVGMNINPEIMPHKIDCGFLNTVLKAETVLLNQGPEAGRSSFGMTKNKSPPITSPITPIATQKVLQGSPRPISGPTTNCPADPPAMTEFRIINDVFDDGGLLFNRTDDSTYSDMRPDKGGVRMS